MTAPHPVEPVSEPCVVGLASADGLDEVEALMNALAFRSRPDPLCNIVREHLAGGGKRVRARLALAASEALGVARQDAVGWGAACEMLHNATLIHDDIQDGDRVRRDRPTAWALHGVAQAINAGDLMLMLPFLALGHSRTTDARRWMLSAALARAADRTVRGQSAELALLERGLVGWDSYAHAVEGKTGALLGLPVEGAAILSGLDAPTSQRFGEEFVRIGLLFQLQDDLLDLTDRKGRDRRGSDLYEGKVSALVVEHMSLHPTDALWLLGLLRMPREETPEEQVELALARFADGGAVDAVRSRMTRIAHAVEESPLLGAVPELRSVAREVMELIRLSADRSAAEMARSQA